jgi:hypothetical protein
MKRPVYREHPLHDCDKSVRWCVNAGVDRRMHAGAWRVARAVVWYEREGFGEPLGEDGAVFCGRALAGALR